MRERIINATIRALHEIRNRRFLATERGYQGAFYCMLHQLLTTEDLITENRILEMEYQKSTRHGLRKRPDIIFHIPAELTGAGVRENNFALWSLKYREVLHKHEKISMIWTCCLQNWNILWAFSSMSIRLTTVWKTMTVHIETVSKHLRLGCWMKRPG